MIKQYIRSHLTSMAPSMNHETLLSFQGSQNLSHGESVWPPGLCSCAGRSQVAANDGPVRDPIMRFCLVNLFSLVRDGRSHYKVTSLPWEPRQFMEKMFSSHDRGSLDMYALCRSSTLPAANCSEIIMDILQDSSIMAGTWQVHMFKLHRRERGWHNLFNDQWLTA